MTVSFQRTYLKEKSSLELLFLFVTVSSRSFFAFVRRYFMSLSFFTTWHSVRVYLLIN
jgi:hypothetical protein